MSVTFHQTDPRWASLSYAGYTMRTAGCGATACASIIVNNPKYKNITPKDTRKFLEPKYTVKGSGTMWSGISACGKHFGFEVTQHSTMAKLWTELNKKQTEWGVILMNNKSHNGIKWTSSGHYLAFSAYKVEGGKHWLYMRDPNPAKGRNHTGWYCYEKHFKGNVKAVWTFKLPKESTAPVKESTTGKKYTGELPSITVKSTCMIGEAASASIGLRRTKWRNFGQTHVFRAKDYKTRELLARAMDDAVANKNIGYAPKKTKAIRTSFYTEAKANKWNIKGIAKKCYTCCSQCVAVCMNAIGISTPHDVNAANLIKNCKAMKDFYCYTDSDVVKKSAKIQRGDIIAGAGIHAVMAVADGGSREYLKYGDVSAEVKKLQEFLNWVGLREGATDNTFGDATYEGVKKWQKLNGLEVDGCFGKASLEKAKNYVKE